LWCYYNILLKINQGKEFRLHYKQVKFEVYDVRI